MNELDHGAEMAVSTFALSIRYGKATAIESVDLRVPDGAVYVLIGANGAGKSSTMKALLNLEVPAAGRAEVFGLDTVTQGPKVRGQIGYVPDAPVPSYPWMTSARLLEHVAAFYPKWDHAYSAHLCDSFGVLVDRKIGTLSKGEMRRLQFVIALAHRPPLLLLDEPTDGLDPVVRLRTLAKLAEHLADTPTTVMISTHHVHEVDSLVDHVGVLSAGKLVAQMSRDQLQRTVRRYRAEVPEGWQLPREVQVAGMRRSAREIQATLVGEEPDVTARLEATGARVHDVKTMTLEEATLAFLSDEAGR